MLDSVHGDLNHERFGMAGASLGNVSLLSGLVAGGAGEFDGRARRGRARPPRSRPRSITLQRCTRLRLGLHRSSVKGDFSEAHLGARAALALSRSDELPPVFPHVVVGVSGYAYDAVWARRRGDSRYEQA